jgi:hypothetical protein
VFAITEGALVLAGLREDRRRFEGQSVPWLLMSVMALPMAGVKPYPVCFSKTSAKQP